MNRPLARMIHGLVATLATLILAGCEVDSGESGSRNVDINVWGVYHGQASHYGLLVNNASGSRPKYFDLRQYGDQLEAIEDHGIIFRGTIGSVNSSAKTCSFTLEGKTTTGNRVIVNGNINISGSEAIMEGTWIEDNLYALLYGKATAPTQPSNALSVSASSTTISTSGTATLSASGGSGSYSWTVQQSALGSVSPAAGSQVTYTAKGTNGTQIVTVSDGSNNKTVTITQQ